MNAQSVVFLFVLAVAGGIFALNVQRLVGYLRLGLVEDRTDRPWARLVNVLRIGIAQTKILREPIAGIMHATIFWGFIVLTAGTVEIFIQGAWSGFSYERVMWHPLYSLYAASQGDGAFLNGNRLKVSPCADLDAATVECGWSTRRSTADYIALVSRVMQAGCAIRRAGSGALGLADVAAGRVEAYCELHINAWDCAAGIVLVREAGGRTNDFFAENGLAAGNPILATNQALCDKLAAIVGIPLIS